jgi:hypothetical protein
MSLSANLTCPPSLPPNDKIDNDVIEDRPSVMFNLCTDPNRIDKRSHLSWMAFHLAVVGHISLPVSN